MFRIEETVDALMKLVGWEQPYNPAQMQLTLDLSESESGLYYQSVHPFLTLTNLISIAPDFANTNWPVYEDDTEYLQGSIVRWEEDNKLYIATVTTNLPPSSRQWEPFTSEKAFSDWLRTKTRGYVQKAITRYYTERMAKGTAKSIVDSRTLFDQAGRLLDREKYSGKWAGFELVPARYNGVTVKIDEIGLQFVSTSNITLYLLHSSHPAPLKTLRLDYTKTGGGLQWFKLDEPLYLPYVSEDTDAGGSYYLVYEQNENNKAIYKNRDWSKAPCGSCSSVDYSSYLAWSKYLEVHPFTVSQQVVDEGREGEPFMWDLADNEYTYLSNHGLNLRLSVVCDLTDFIIRHRAEFTDLILKSVAVDFLREMLYNANVRTNRNSLNVSKPDLVRLLDGDFDIDRKGNTVASRNGLIAELDNVYKALNFNFRGIDKVCQPCCNNGIRYTTT